MRTLISQCGYHTAYPGPQVIRAFEFDVEGETARSAREGGRKQFEVLITTYELVLKDASVLSKVGPHLC